MMFVSMLLLLLVGMSGGQIQQDGCGNTCPPINFGKEVPALCVGDVMNENSIGNSNNYHRLYDICHPKSSSSSNQFSWKELQEDSKNKNKNKIVVVANYYTGCNAGRRESGVYAHVAQRIWEEYSDEIVFIQSVKGGGSCSSWADIYQSDANELYPQSNIVPKEMPWSVSDDDYSIRDDLFTTPFGHPSYVILDSTNNTNKDFQIIAKFIGPCCGYYDYYDCTADIAKQLDTQLTNILIPLLSSPPTQGPTPTPTIAVTNTNSSTTEIPTKAPVTVAPTTTAVPTVSPTTAVPCEIGDWSDWSDCSVRCGVTSGIQFRHRLPNSTCSSTGTAAVVETQTCWPSVVTCPGDFTSSTNNNNNNNYNDTEPPTQSACIPEFGSSYTVDVVVQDLNEPRDVAFHPTPGLHLGHYSEGRVFPTNDGSEEAWVVNAGNHSVSIVTHVGTKKQSTLSRRDRGYYHYSIDVSAIAFNDVKNSGRSADRDGLNYFALCNANANTYLNTKEPNYFMGPTLYDTKPMNRNVVNRRGDLCQPHDQPCYFLHADMLHESPVCIGLAHDPETITSYGHVYWAFDATGNNNGDHGQLVRFDFQQPHGPGSMDHSIAAVRRYVDISLHRQTNNPSSPPPTTTNNNNNNNKNNSESVHAGMMVHEELRMVLVANPGKNEILWVDADSGAYARTARQEFPIFSNRLPSFEYSIWECVSSGIFASGIQNPSGLTLSHDKQRLFVAERHTGNILVYEVSSGSFLHSIPTNYQSIAGLAISPNTHQLYFVDQTTNQLLTIKPQSTCTTPFTTRLNSNFIQQLQQAQQQHSSSSGSDNWRSWVYSREGTCEVDSTIPNATYFDQVHTDSGYADSNVDVVQSNSTGMDTNAALLANRTDCGYTSELNFDALLLGGYYCHVCLPEQDLTCDAGGQCTNIPWLGYTCNNEYYITIFSNNNNNNTIRITHPSNNSLPLKPSTVILKRNVTYRFIVQILSPTNNDKTMKLCTSTTTDPKTTSTDSSVEVVTCASNGPLLVSIPTCFPNEQLDFIVTGGNTKFGISLPIQNPPKDDDEKEDTTPPPSKKNNVHPTTINTLLFLTTTIMTFLSIY
jgi:hypothetical protein